MELITTSIYIDQVETENSYVEKLKINDGTSNAITLEELFERYIMMGDYSAVVNIEIQDGVLKFSKV